MSDNFTILVLDDNPASLYTTSHVLRKMGWTVIEAQTGSQAIEYAKQGIDLAILDINLPDIDGFEVCRTIRAQADQARFPVIHLSATFVKASSKIHSFEVGADGFLTHPVEPQVLVATVGAFLRARKAEREREQLLLSERAARMEAERANRFKDDFLATLSHELRTPLQAIIGWAQLLQVGNHTKADFLEGLHAIEESAQSQSRMIADLLDISRIESGKIRLDSKPIDLNQVVDTVLGSILPVAESKQITIEKSLSAEPIVMIGDAYRLRQVIWNLMNNAIKFTPSRGRVGVQVSEKEGFAEITVSDNGKGIDPAILTQIFERFKQADSSSTREHGGLGLGLAVAKQLVELHQGTIRAESSGVGTGATFLVLLPLLARQNEQRDRGESGDDLDDSLSLEDLRIMVVDDDFTTRRMLSRILTSYGAFIRECEGAEGIVERLKEFEPHVLISDLGMPRHNGFELIRLVRETEGPFQHVPAIALTAFVRPEDSQRAIDSGFQVHMSKPVDLQKLKATVLKLSGQ